MSMIIKKCFFKKFVDPSKCSFIYLHLPGPRFNPFLVNVPLSYPLKKTENQKFSSGVRGCKTRILARNGLKTSLVSVNCPSIVWSVNFVKAK